MRPLEWITIIATDWDEPEIEFHASRRDADDYVLGIWRDFYENEAMTLKELYDLPMQSGDYWWVKRIELPKRYIIGVPKRSPLDAFISSVIVRFKLQRRKP